MDFAVVRFYWIYSNKQNSVMLWERKSIGIMKKRHLVFCMLVLALSVGCDEEKRGEVVSTESQPKVTQQVTESGETELPVYTIDMDTMQSVRETVYLMEGEKLNSENILKKVIELFKINAIEIEVNGIKQKKDVMYVSFAKNSAPIVDVSQKVEEVILESIAKSLLDNLEDVNKIVFQVDSEAYKSENLELGKNEVYWWK